MKTIKLDINSISDECYKQLLKEFKQKAKEEGINWDEVEEDYLQLWEIKCELQKN
jgi:hypothetical protein